MSDPHRPPLLHGRRILLVEDDWFVADELCRELEDHGATVLGPAPGVAEAMALLERGDRPDAALLDVQLGGETSFALADLLRGQGVPVVLATAYGPRDLPEPYALLPRCEKPLDMRQLLRVLSG
jgi:CheY-like chemotaxis protein